MKTLVERESVFGTAESTRQQPGESDIDHAHRTYRPSFPGVHVCGADHEDNRFFTVLDIPARSSEGAYAMWEAMRAECEVGEDERDYAVDLNDDDGCDIDFPTNRQMLSRLLEIANAGDPTLKDTSHG